MCGNVTDLFVCARGGLAQNSDRKSMNRLVRDKCILTSIAGLLDKLQKPYTSQSFLDLLRSRLLQTSRMQFSAVLLLTRSTLAALLSPESLERFFEALGTIPVSPYQQFSTSQQIPLDLIFILNHSFDASDHLLWRLSRQQLMPTIATSLVTKRRLMPLLRFVRAKVAATTLWADQPAASSC